MTMSNPAAVAFAVLETLAELGPQPEGHLFAVLLGEGIELHEFQAVASALVSKKLSRRLAGPRLEITETGRKFCEIGRRAMNTAKAEGKLQTA
ncbi:MAG: hypothetical protein ACIAQU_04260 [Phycisphaerales bacterium JB064]